MEIRPRHGVRIKPVSSRDMREIYQILTSLESCAAELAARRGLSTAEIETLGHAVGEMEEALTRKSISIQGLVRSRPDVVRRACKPDTGAEWKSGPPEIWHRARHPK